MKDLLKRVGLNEADYYKYAHEFSGGQRQRVGIARALALKPRLIIADEPVSALDVSVQSQVLNIMDELQEEMGLSYLFIAHDLSVVKHVSDYICVMYLGHILEQGPADAIYENPQHPYTQSLISAIPDINPTQRKKRILLRVICHLRVIRQWVVHSIHVARLLRRDVHNKTTSSRGRQRTLCGMRIT